MLNIYELGKNYILSCNNFDLNILNNNNILTFMCGYIELNSKLIMPSINNITENDSPHIVHKKIKNIDSNYQFAINYDKNSPYFIIFFRKQDKLILQKLLDFINDFCNIEYTINVQIITYNKIKYNTKVIFKGYNVLNFLSKIFNSDINKNDIDEYLYNMYINLANFKYISYNSENEFVYSILPKCKIKLMNQSAIFPTKHNASDIGYDIHIIKRYKNISDKIIIYDTGIQLIPQFGYYYELIPTFSLSTTGYILGNSVGIINPINQDNTKKTLLITLIKIDKTMREIQLPFKCCQLLLKEMNHYELV